MLIARFSSKLTRYQRKKKYNLNENYNQTNNGENLMLNLPTTDADIRSMYLSGRQSVIKNLPISKVECIKDHSCCSIRSCLTDFLMLGKLPPKTKRNRRNGDSIFKIEELCLYVFMNYDRIALTYLDIVKTVKYLLFFGSE